MSNIIGNLFRSIIEYCSGCSFSKWMVLLQDLVIVLIVFFIIILIGDCTPLGTSSIDILGKMITVLLMYVISFAYTKPYYGILRHAGMGDVMMIFKANVLVCVMYLFFKILSNFFSSFSYYLLPVFEMIFEVSFVFALMVFVRIVVIFFCREFSPNQINNRSNVIIYGTGSVGVVVNNALKQEDYNNKVVAFTDDNHGKMNKSIDRTPILPVNEVLKESFVKANNIDSLIIASPTISVKRRQELVNLALNLKLKVKLVPKFDTWINNSFSTTMLQNIKIEDLLERDPIVLNESNIEKVIDNKVILVTGAAGSIGAEIVRQIIMHNPRRVIALDQAETPMFELQFELKNSESYRKYSSRVVYEIADVTDELVINSIFEKYHPDVIYHAAAYKHVPLMEENPYEATLVNVFGTKILVELAIKYRVEKFLMISTDKAVNPTNVMGATKRLAEIFVQSRSSDCTCFVTTRFGNVLGSNGSVIPLFRKQLEQGGPLTVTHKEMIRYFMTIPEASSLVLEASAIGLGGDIFAFDMGKPVKIYDLAKNMIALSKMDGIRIEEVGLRAGEKLYEELLSSKENTIPTEHPKIMHALVNKYEKSQVDTFMEELRVCLLSCDPDRIVAKIKEFVPEYISNNSEFSKLDKKNKK